MPTCCLSLGRPLSQAAAEQLAARLALGELPADWQRPERAHALPLLELTLRQAHCVSSSFVIATIAPDVEVLSILVRGQLIGCSLELTRAH